MMSPQRSTLFPYTTLFRSPAGGPWLQTGEHPQHLAAWVVQVLWQEFEEDLPQRDGPGRSEEHTSELQSRGHIVCRLLLEKKKLTAYTDISFRTHLRTRELP